VDKPMPSWAFQGMAFMFKVRDFFFPREDILAEVEIKPGFRVLDFGCGPGAYVADAAVRVGESGRVYALDIHPLAVETVRRLAEKKRLANVKAIQSDCQTGLPDDSIDVVLLYDIFHMLSQPQAVLAELHRVLKSDGVLSLVPEHMKEDEAIARMTSNRLFKLSRKGGKTYSFTPRGHPD